MKVSGLSLDESVEDLISQEHTSHLDSSVNILPRLRPFPFNPFFFVATARLAGLMVPLVLAAGEKEPEA